MDKNELNEALNELSGHVASISQAIGCTRSTYELRLLGSSLIRSAEELDRLANILHVQGQ